MTSGVEIGPEGGRVYLRVKNPSTVEVDTGTTYDCTRFV